ncbi:hypothetical protein EV176_007523, partial [Coemansia sp. RSA 451]
TRCMTWVFCRPTWDLSRVRQIQRSRYCAKTVCCWSNCSSCKTHERKALIMERSATVSSKLPSGCKQTWPMWLLRMRRLMYGRRRMRSSMQLNCFSATYRLLLRARCRHNDALHICRMQSLGLMCRRTQHLRPCNKSPTKS